jgi:hypothetical protein
VSPKSTHTVDSGNSTRERLLLTLPSGQFLWPRLFGGFAIPKYPREKGKPIDLPVYGDAEHNMRIYQAVGVLVINWGSDESLFLAMLQALLAGDKPSAIITWASFHNTANRLELVRRLTRQHVTDKALRADIESAISEFAGCTKTRNFFCHAAYGFDDQARLAVAHSINLPTTRGHQFATLRDL